MVSSVQAGSVYDGAYVRLMEDGVLLYGEPGEPDGLQESMPADTLLLMTGMEQKDGDVWVQVRYNGKQGYIRGGTAQVMTMEQMQDYLREQRVSAVTPEPEAPSYAFAVAQGDGGAEYAVVTGYTGPCDAGIEIPAQMDGLTVKAIAGGMLEGRGDLTGRITLPAGLESIGESAFRGCSGLTGALTLPGMMVRIGKYAFCGCEGLTGGLNLPELLVIEEYAFASCSGLTGALTIPDMTREIGSCAFMGCSGLTEVVLPASVAYIAPDAFSGCAPGLTFVVDRGSYGASWVRENNLMYRYSVRDDAIVAQGHAIGSVGNQITVAVTVENDRIVTCLVQDENATEHMRKGYDFCVRTLTGQECEYVSASSAKSLFGEVRSLAQAEGYTVKTGGTAHESINNAIAAVKDALGQIGY